MTQGPNNPFPGRERDKTGSKQTLPREGAERDEPGSKQTLPRDEER